MIHAVAQTTTSEILTDISLDDLSAKEFRWYWVDFDSPFDEEAALLRTYFRFDDLSSMIAWNGWNVQKLIFTIHTIFLFFMLWRKRRWNPLNWTYLSAGITLLPFINELRWRYGYFIVLGIMVGIGIAMFLWFKRKGWFDMKK